MELCIFKAVLNHEVAHPANPKKQVSTIFSQVRKLRYHVQQLTQHIQHCQEHRLPDFHSDSQLGCLLPRKRKYRHLATLILYFYMLSRLKFHCRRPRSLKVIAHQRVEFEAYDYSPTSSTVQMLCSGDLVAKSRYWRMKKPGLRSKLHDLAKVI